MKKLISIFTTVIVLTSLFACKDTGNSYFRFDDYNTRMELPEVWREGVSIQKSSKADDGASAAYIATFIGKDGKENQFLGAIYVFTPEQWKAVSDEWKGVYVQVGAVDNLLYYYKSSQSNPFDEQEAIGQEYTQHVITMPDAPKLIHIEK